MWKINQALAPVCQRNINKWLVLWWSLQASMEDFRTALRRARDDVIHFTGLAALLRPVLGGAGAILSLNSLSPPWCDPLRPENRPGPHPRFLDALLDYLRRERIDIVTPDEIAGRLKKDGPQRRFVCLTLDGAYRDHFDDAFPIFKKHSAPFTVFVPTSLPDRLGDLWWMALAAVVAKSPSLAMVLDGREQHVDARTAGDKRHVYRGLTRWLLSRADNTEIVAFVADLAARYGVDMAELRERVCMTWQQIATLAADPLVTIGAQTVTHPVLSKVSSKAVEREMRMSRLVIESAIGIMPRHFAYPFGQAAFAREREFAIARDLGFVTAMTLRPGVLRLADCGRMTALPRIALPGRLQRLRSARVALSGTSSMFSRPRGRG
jgi:peptidoglycan/xylan/chitin deacetylase (PgdA/CDA1 family)